MGKKQEKKGGSFFAQLFWQNLPEPVKVPSLPKVETEDDLKEVVHQIEQTAREIEGYVKKILHCRKRFDSLSGIERELVSGEEIEKISSALSEASQRIESLLQSDILAYRRAVVVGYLLFTFQKMAGMEGVNKEEILRELEALEKKGFLLPAKNGDGQLKILGLAYVTPPELSFSESDIKRLREAIHEIGERYREDLRKKSKEMLSMEEALTLEQFLAGIPGKFALRVPSRKKEEKWIPGATILVRVEKHPKREVLVIHPEEAIGAGPIVEATQEMKKAGVYLLYNAIFREWRPVSLPTVRRNDEMNHHLKTFWWFIREGVTAEEKRKQKEEMEREERKRMERGATISPSEFFEGKEGIVFLEFEGVWRDAINQRRIMNIFLLIERRDQRIRLQEIPAHLEFFLGNCRGKDFSEKPGDKFATVDQPLQAILRAIYKQVVNRQRSV